jgi:hypothetical protein
MLTSGFLRTGWNISTLAPPWRGESLRASLPGMAWSDWAVVAGTLGGVAVTGTLGLRTAKLNHRWQREAREETRRQARGDLRRDAYVAYLVQSQQLIDETAAWMDSAGAALPQEDRMRAYVVALGPSAHRHDACERRAMLVAGPRVREALATYRDWFRQATAQVLSEQSPGFSGEDEREKPLVDVMIEEIDADMAIRDEIR